MTNQLLRVRVVGKHLAAQDIAAFELQALDQAELPSFDAGAHIDVHLPNGLVRQYSLCNDPRTRDRYRICVLRDAATRGGSAAMHDLVAAGDVLAIGAPRNLFPLVPGSHSTLLLAGGIGVTPMLAMAWRLHAQEVPFELHYFTRSAARTAFHDEIREAPFAASTSLWFDDADMPQRPSIAALLARAAPGTHVYACGPAGFLEHVMRSCEQAAWPTSQLHYETFAAAPVQQGEAFDVQVRSSGLTVRVAHDQSVVEALAAHGVVIPVSCEQGICGTCLTGIREGRADHRDQYLTDEEHARGDQFTPCCSRALTPLLVLDL
ncbi:MAG: PDR/VanB family oxidoreductase [Pseudomonadota bacterium]